MPLGSPGGVTVTLTLAVPWAATVTSGRASRTIATAPATCGEDIDVPLSVAYPPRAIGNVDRMLPPGAPRSGLVVRSGDGPYAEKLETRLPVGFGTVVSFVVHVI